MVEFEKILTLSTGHMPESSPRFGTCRVLKYEYGYVVWVSFDELLELDSEEWLQKIMKHAWEEDCRLIMFDCGAEMDKDLFPIYDW